MSDERKYPYRPRLSSMGLRKLTELSKWRGLEKNIIVEVLIDDAYNRMKAEVKL